jgi:hypothetical protein
METRTRVNTSCFLLCGYIAIERADKTSWDIYRKDLTGSSDGYVCTVADEDEATRRIRCLAQSD